MNYVFISPIAFEGSVQDKGRLSCGISHTHN